jgi:probable HAF family extracellular repeat protein
LYLEPLEARCALSAYTVTDLGTFGGTHSDARDVNARGQSTGFAETPCDCLNEPFLWSDGVLQYLGKPGYAFGVNDAGSVVGQLIPGGDAFLWRRQRGMVDLGFYGEAHKLNDRTEIVGEMGMPEEHAFLWRQGQVTDLGTLGGLWSQAQDINRRTEVVGQAGSSSTAPHAFLWTEAAGMKDLGSLDGDPGSTSGAEAINDLGQIVGASYAQALHTTHAAYFSPSGVVDLGTLGGFSEATGLNNLGQFVGDAFTLAGDDHAFLTDLATRRMVDLNSLIPPDSGWTLDLAFAINARGQVVGRGHIGDQTHGYLLSPTSTLAGPLMMATQVTAGATDAWANGACQAGFPLVGRAAPSQWTVEEYTVARAARAVREPEGVRRRRVSDPADSAGLGVWLGIGWPE